jgi:hypothetical protein
VAALKKVDFPQFGFPARARVIMAVPQITVIACRTKIRTESDKAFHPGLLKGTYDVY